MSVYSGFVTRQQETAYFSLTEQLVYTLQLALLKSLQGTAESSAQVAAELLPVYVQLARMETNKYTPPKISKCCRQLANFLGNDYNHLQEGSLSHTHQENDWLFASSPPRSARGVSTGGKSFSDASKRRRAKLSSSLIVQQERSHHGAIQYETTVIEEKRSRQSRRNYYVSVFTKKLSSQTPTDRQKASSKPKQSIDPFKSGRHLMMPITALI